MTNENWILEFVILSVIILLYNLFLNKEYSKTLAIVNLGYSLIAIYKVDMDYVSIVPSIAISLISIVSFLIRIRKEESKAYDALSFVGILIFLINIIDVYTEKLLVLPLGIIIVTDMLIVVADVVKDRKEGLAYKVILDVLTMILLAYAISTSYYIIPMVLVVLVSSLVSTYALKSDYAEQYILPFKTVLCIIGLLVEINTHIKLDYILIILIINVFTTLSAYFQKNEKFKRLFIVISVITLFDAFGVETPFEFIVLLSMIVFDYLIFFVADKRSKSFEKLYVILSILIILSRLSLFDNALLYLVAALIFVVGHVMMKDKFLSVVSLVACLFSTVYFISGINISYEVQDVLCPLILCGGVFYITSIVKEFDTPMLKALIIIILSVILMYNSTLISLLVALAVNIIVLIVFIKNNNIIFKSSVVLTALCIINIMQELDEVPTFVYMLIIGLTVVFVIFKSIQKYMNEPEKEEEKPKVIKTGKKYCVQCGNEISSRTKFCGKCGTKVNK